MNKVAVVLTHYREELTDDEAISLRQMYAHLGRYDKFLVFPDTLSPRFKTMDVCLRRLNRKYFENLSSYSRLLVSEEFYNLFRQYEYILIYQMDCLVFRDELLEWCYRGYDYVGAPLFRHALKKDGPFFAVGNGGFSLRNVASFLRVLRCPLPDYRGFFRMPITRYTLYLLLIHNLMRLFRIPRFFRYYKNLFFENEDMFWSFFAETGLPSFSIPDVDTALGFSFEKKPRICFDLTGGTLPFGCHAWARYDREFWISHLTERE
ncbi:MAG: DUF5672 family protein [Kiritimatiellales bacterium]